jgi:hypothetical protein
MHQPVAALPGASSLLLDPAGQALSQQVFGRRSTSGPIMIGGGIFGAHSNAATALAANTAAKVNFQVTDFDTSGNFSSSRFTPQVPGYYQIHGNVSAGATTSYLIAIISKNNAGGNGLSGQYVFVAAGTAGLFGHVTGIVFLNGSTDFVEIWAQSGAAINTGGSATTDYFHGAWIHP